MSCFFFSSRRRHTRLQGDWSSDVCSSDLNYLASKHTLKYLRAGELALTKLAERNSWDTWEGKFERKGMADYAIDEAERILREHIVPPLEPQQEKELDKIMAAAEKEMIKPKKKIEYTYK